jgi:hypothetical protein
METKRGFFFWFFEVVGALCVFAIPILFLFIGSALGIQ